MDCSLCLVKVRRDGLLSSGCSNELCSQLVGTSPHSIHKVSFDTWVICAHWCVRAGSCVPQQVLSLGKKLGCWPFVAHYCLCQGSWPESSWEFSCLHAPSHYWNAGNADAGYHVWLYVESENLDSGPHSCEVHASPTEPSPQAERLVLLFLFLVPSDGNDEQLTLWKGDPQLNLE